MVLFDIGLQEKNVLLERGIKSSTTGISLINHLTYKHLPRIVGPSPELLDSLRSDSDFKLLNDIFGDNSWAIANLMNRFRSTQSPPNPNGALFNYELAEDLERVYFFDNVYELWLRESGFLGLDANYYGEVWEYLSKKGEFTLEKLLQALDERVEGFSGKYKRKIPFKVQDGLFCGLTCLENSLASFGLDSEDVSKPEWKERIPTDGNYNNLPTTLVKIALEEGYPSYLIINMGDYERNVINSPKWRDHVVLKRMLSEMRDISTVHVEGINGEFVKKVIQEGGTVSFVVDYKGDSSYGLHYNLAYGYDGEDILIFDPLGQKGTVRIGDFEEYAKNVYSSWGFVVFPRGHSVHNGLKKNISGMKIFLEENFGGEMNEERMVSGRK